MHLASYNAYLSITPHSTFSIIDCHTSYKNPYLLTASFCTCLITRRYFSVVLMSLCQKRRVLIQVDWFRQEGIGVAAVGRLGVQKILVFGTFSVA